MAVTKGSDNPFPSILFEEHVDPATPPSGHWRLFVDTDNILKLIDDAGTVTAVGAGSGGVATDTLWNAKGDLAGGTGSDTAARLAVGANDTILMADSGQSTGLKWVASQTPSTQAFSDSAAEGTADTYARGDHKHAMPASPGGGGALVFLEAHTASASSSLDFTAFLSSTYDDYVFEIVNLVPATNGVDCLMRMGTGGGPTYDAGSNYYNPGSTTGIQVAATLANNAGYGNVSGTLRLLSPQSTSLMKYLHGSTVWHNGSVVSGGGRGGLWADTTAVTAVRFIMSSGNITSGVVRVYGVAKS